MSKCIFIGAAALTLAGQVSATTFDFEAGLPAEVSGVAITESVGGLQGINGFSGTMLRSLGTTGETTQIDLSGLAGHDTVTLTFNLALLDSWDAVDGNVAPDFFNIVADGSEVFEMSVSNASGTVEQIPAGATNRTSGSDLFGASWNDSLFDVSFSFAHTGETLGLSLFADGAGWQGGFDESWAIDNLSVTVSGTPVSAVPLPASVALLLVAFGLFVPLRRRLRVD